MSIRAKKRIKILSVIAAVIAVIVLVRLLGRDDGLELAAYNTSDTSYEESYAAYLDNFGYDGAMSGEVVEVPLTPVSGTGFIRTEDSDILYTQDEGSVMLVFEVEQEGFYNLRLTYIPMPGTTSEIQRRILLDGRQCYDALSQIVLKRLYSDAEIKVKNDNEIRPSAMEIMEETDVFVEDFGRRNGEPLKFYLSRGRHSLTFEAVKEPVAFTKITFESKEKERGYAEVIDSLKRMYPVYSGETLTGQAERADGITRKVYKSSSSININKNYSDANLMPYHPYHIVYNTIGGSSWKSSGDRITWELEVPETGLYSITLKGRQAVNRGVTSYRRIMVNGSVPYAELNAYPFNYNAEMVNYTIADEQGEPYLFLLNRGTNTLTLEVVLGEFGSVLTTVEESMFELNSLYLKTTQLTGTSPSRFIDYEIRKKLPDFVEIMTREHDRLYDAECEMVAITGEKGEQTVLLEKMVIEAGGLIKDPESVVEELSRWKDNIAALGTWAVNISEMPLELDAIMLGGAEPELPDATAGFFKSAYNGICRFVASFFVKTDEVTGANDPDAAGGDTLTVWMVSSGKEQAQILQNMIDETFTPKTDIQVKLQLIPLDVVLRAALSGNSPDVLVGVNQGTLADFAMRNALVDLSGLEGFDREAARFYDSAITAATYQGGVYGLPETQTCLMLFTRDDILADMGIATPETWADIREMIPILQRNNYTFAMPKSEFLASMIYQYGGDFYLGSGNDYGIESGLAGDEAMKAFKDLTDFFTTYKLPVTIDFNSRFRTGECPAGIVNYTTFCTLEIYAPEIKGLWSFHPIPGVVRADGTVDNTYVSDSAQCVIMSSSDDIPDAWTFVKWWTGTDAQLTFANTVESVMGSSARYAAADREVLRQLPWSSSELKELTAQLGATRGIPAVPGSYMTTRMISYSFDDVVANYANPRETLYINMKAINKELTKKRKEFGLSYVDKR